MTKLGWVICSVLCAFACAPDEGYLIVGVDYPPEAYGKLGRIVVRRNSGPPISDGPFAIAEESASRRISVHAEGHELDAELELHVALCDGQDQVTCTESSTLDLHNAFDAEHTRSLCIDFASLKRGRWPEAVDLASGSLPEGLTRCD